MSAPKTVLYHQEGREPKTFAVLAEHKDGTIDIGPAGGDPVVTSARVLDQPRFGFCTTVAESPTDGENLADKKVDELRAIAKELGIESAGLKKDDLIAAIQAAKKTE